MRQRSNAARFSRIVSSVPAPPATYAKPSGVIALRARLLEALERDGHARVGASRPAHVDLELPLPPDPGRWAVGGRL